MEAGLRPCSGRKRWYRVVTLAAGLAVFFAVPAQAATDSLDQAQTLTLSFQRLPLMAQTFTPATPGTIDRVSIAADTQFGAVSLTVQIQSVDASGAPSGTVLGSTTFVGRVQCCQQFHDFAFSNGVGVSAGTKYAIVVLAVGQFTWYDSWQIDAYAGGQLYLGCNGCAWMTGSQFGDDFAFKDWLASSVNQAPSVHADNAAVAVAEGTAAVNTGSFADTDGDTVSLSASAGTVTKSGTSSGTWSWSQPATDEATAQTVTITADDGHSLSSSTSFSVTATPVAPTASITTDPITSPEGTSIGLAGAATSPDPADNAAGFAFNWTVTKNGNSYRSGSGTSFNFTPDDEGTFVVTMQATDDGGLTGVASQTIVGTNVAPTAKITGVSAGAPLVLTPQEQVTFDGNFTDPGALDTHLVTWNFGDGSTGASSYGAGGSARFSAAHSYSAAGTYKVTLTVTDDDGGVGTATTQVSVETPQQALSAITAYLGGLKGLNAGERNSLEAKLNAASAAATRGDTTAAHNQLNAFLNEVSADVSTGKLSASNAATLDAAVHAVQAALGNYNRFLEWWPLTF